jgi:hypothetical protein
MSEVETRSKLIRPALKITGFGIVETVTLLASAL